MALILSNILTKSCIKSLEDKLLALSINNQVRERHGMLPRPRLRNPTWLTKQTLAKHNSDDLTPENRSFINEVITDRFSEPAPQINKDLISNAEWNPKLQRTGVIARKIGNYPLWLKNGNKIHTTLLQVLDNHVIKYTSPENYDPPRKRVGKIYNKKGVILIGAEGGDPSNFTREYCGLFKDSGVIPKKILGRFFVSPDAALPLGTLISAMHFQVGNVVDVRGLTIDYGFQGVIKRHGFKGMPASHGVTKTHRRGGCIGGGGEKGRVWPGTKMPGHMGNRYRYARGLKIWRINTKYNVLWVSGVAIPGATNSIVYVYDTKLPQRQPTKAVPFPTYMSEVDDSVPEDYFDEEVHRFGEPTIVYEDIA